MLGDVICGLTNQHNILVFINHSTVNNFSAGGLFCNDASLALFYPLHKTLLQLSAFVYESLFRNILAAII